MNQTKRSITILEKTYPIVNTIDQSIPVEAWMKRCKIAKEHWITSERFTIRRVFEFENGSLSKSFDLSDLTNEEIQQVIDESNQVKLFEYSASDTKIN